MVVSDETYAVRAAPNVCLLDKSETSTVNIVSAGTSSCHSNTVFDLKTIYDNVYNQAALSL